MVRRDRFVSIGIGVVILLGVITSPPVTGQGGRGRKASPDNPMSLVLGCPTDRSITVSVLSPLAIEAFLEYGAGTGQYPEKTAVAEGAAGAPFEIAIAPLKANTRYYYRFRHRRPGSTEFAALAEQTFMTARAAGSTFTFAIQGDSHPERDGRMYDAGLYRRTLDLVATERPDFYFMLGDDFSIERLISQRSATQATVDEVYAAQRTFLTRLTGSSSLFLINGNHEEAARFLLDGTPNNPAVFAAKARTRFYPLPAPDAFYSGDTQSEAHIGLLRDYYAWTWGDALFVVIDPYWHSPVLVDAPPGGGGGGAGGGRNAAGGRQANRGNAARGAGRDRDMWAITLGDAQYAWLKRTLETSQARYKFVFTHHVMGTGRGAIEGADFYEWGGRDPRGAATFKEKRPTWELPIHPLMVKTGVTILFQGHDHLFARQQKDGITYQEVPNPADLTYTVFNRDAYRSGDILPNAGHLLVTVAPDQVRVDYIRSYLPKDETSDRKNGEVALSYTVKTRMPGGR
jgi:hypothetical protein